MVNSGSSNNVSGTSSGASSSRERNGRVVGVPRCCWCEAPILALISKSDHNPYRRYYRCAFAVANKLKNDNHVFKWVDEALLDHIERLELKNGRLEEEVKLIKSEFMKYDDKLMVNFQMKLESEIVDRVEVVLSEAKWSMKKTMIMLVVGCLIVVAFISVLGA